MVSKIISVSLRNQWGFAHQHSDWEVECTAAADCEGVSNGLREGTAWWTRQGKGSIPSRTWDLSPGLVINWLNSTDASGSSSMEWRGLSDTSHFSQEWPHSSQHLWLRWRHCYCKWDGAILVSSGEGCCHIPHGPHGPKAPWNRSIQSVIQQNLS